MVIAILDPLPVLLVLPIASFFRGWQSHGLITGTHRAYRQARNPTVPPPLA